MRASQRLGGRFAYPLKYGYPSLGGWSTPAPGAARSGWESWFSPSTRMKAISWHRSRACCRCQAGLQPETAVFLPNMETAVNLVMDGAPLIGERVAVLGQGIVGLLTTALLARFPLERLVTLDRYALRRQASLALGAEASLDPSDPRRRASAGAAGGRGRSVLSS